MENTKLEKVQIPLIRRVFYCENLIPFNTSKRKNFSGRRKDNPFIIKGKVGLKMLGEMI